jgi:hypothetical protein
MKAADPFDEAGTVVPLRPDRRDLTSAAWCERILPERDHLLGKVLCTTSRWMIVGDTGVGKTLWGIDLGHALKAGANYLHWDGVRPCRVMYLDGELPAETFKERIKASVAIYSADGAGEFFGYNRDVLTANDMPPLNIEQGQQWLWREIAIVKPDVIIFDSIMGLLIGSMMDEDHWRPMLPLIRGLSSKRIAQVWLHHTGHDTSRGYGPKLREWEFDSVSLLTPEAGAENELRFEFTKARLRTPATAAQFKPQIIRRDEHGWTTKPAPAATKPGTGAERKRAWLLETYDELAGDTELVPGHTKQPVRKVAIESIRQRMIKRGYLDTEDGKVPSRERVAFQRAREELIKKNTLTAEGEHLWRPPT